MLSHYILRDHDNRQEKPFLNLDNLPTWVARGNHDMTNAGKSGPFSTVLAAMDDVFAMATYDADMRLIGANDSFLRLFDYAIGEILGRDERLFMTEDDAAATFEPMWRDLRQGKTSTSLIKLLRYCHP